MSTFESSKFVLLAGALSVCSIAACGDDDGGGTTAAQIDRACNTFCGKFAECDLLLGMSASACASNCRMQAMSGSSDCEVSNAEADRCISAIESAECAPLSMGMTPPECDLCPSSTPPPAPPGSPDAGSGASCADLVPCCAQLAEEQRMGCMSLTESGNDSLCGSALSGFRGSGMCT